MKIVSNKKLIKRNARIGQIATISSLVILLGGLALSFQAQWLTYSFIALLVGFVTSQIGIYFGNRFGRSPRPDESLSSALKGFDDKYTLYHYMTPVSHLLVGPAGIWVLLPYSQKGTITFDEAKKRWKQKGGNAYLKIFAQESLGRPDLDVKTSVLDMQNYLVKAAEGIGIPPVQAALVFTNEKVVVDAANAPAPTMPADKLKDFIRRKSKEEPTSLEYIRIVQKILPTESLE